MLNLFQRKDKGYRDLCCEELRSLIASEKTLQLVDVRGHGEYRGGHLEQARLVPLPELASRCGELDPEKPVVVYCHSGARSQRAARMLVERGFADICHLAGGIARWDGKIVR